MKSASLLSILALSVPASAWADDGMAENHLVDVAVAYRAQNWEAAFEGLSAARQEAVSPTMRAKIERQAGLVFAAVDRPTDALQAFREALALDRTLGLEAGLFGPGVESLFDCARRLPPVTPRVQRLEADGEGWVCPLRDTAPPTGPAPGGIATGPAAGAAPTGPAAGAAPTGPAAGAAPTGPAAGAAPTGPAAGVAPTGPAPRGVAPEPTMPGLEGLGIEAEKSAEGDGIGAIGGLGIGLIAAGLAGGGGVFAWQFVEAQGANDDIARLDRRIRELELARMEGGPVLTAAYNRAQEDRASQENNAIIAASVGGGTAAVGLVMLLIDLADGGEPASAPLAARPRVSFGPGVGYFQIAF